MSNRVVDSPDFLADVPRAVLKALDVSEVFREALIARGGPEMYGPLLAFYDIDSYLEAAKRQQRRIRRSRASIDKALREGRRKRGDGLFADIHFYVIAWSRVNKLACSMRKTTWLRRLGLVLSRHRAELNRRTQARHHLEHFEDRLPGGKRRRKLKEPNDLLNMRNDFLTYGGKRLDVGPKSMRLLNEIVAEIRLAVLYDSLEALAISDRPRLVRLLQRAARETHTARLIKSAIGSVAGHQRTK
jgi:hypothetical protein